MRRPYPLLGSSSYGGRYDGWCHEAVAEGYGVSVRTVAKWVQRCWHRRIDERSMSAQRQLDSAHIARGRQPITIPSGGNWRV